MLMVGAFLNSGGYLLILMAVTQKIIREAFTTLKLPTIGSSVRADLINIAFDISVISLSMIHTSKDILSICLMGISPTQFIFILQLELFLVPKVVFI